MAPRDRERSLEMSPDPSTVPVDPGEIRRIAACGPDPRWDDWIASATAEARSLMEPRVRAARLDAGEAARLFSSSTPVEAIAREGECWAFVATVGPRLEMRVASRFSSGLAVEGLFLDAAGSAGVEGLCDLAERWCAAGGATSRFSPGYCGWEVVDQQRLFSLLSPQGLGVRLLPSMMMSPVKSVAGLVVRGEPGRLEVPSDACASCDAAGCTRRRAGRREP